MAVKELTPENPQDTMRRSSRRTLAPKRLEYSPEATTTESTPKKSRSESHKTKSSSHQTSKDQRNGELSAYELERLENIRKNQEFLSSLEIFQVSNELKQSVRPKAPQRGLKRPLTERAKSEVLPPRRSMRLQNMEAETQQLPLDVAQTNGRVDTSTPPKKPSGPLLMEPVNLSDGKLPEKLQEIWAESPAKEENKKVDLKRYRSTLASMKMTEDRVAKVVKDRIFSMAFHPCSSTVLMAAGDKWGRVGLWSLSSAWGDDGVLLFEPHSRPVPCMAFSSANPADLLSGSYDGTLRRMDVEKAVFDEVYDFEDGLKTFDFLSHDGMSLLVGSWYGDIAIVDRRTPGNSHESLHTLDTKVLRCVCVHPMKRQYFAVAESQVVNIYDSRFLRKSKNTAVCELLGHSKSITSAYYSPESGNRILTTCLDDHIRIYDTSTSTSAPLLKSISHDMRTGRWLSKLSAVWDPKQEDCFAIGSMSRQRCMQVFHESGQLLHTFRDENLTTVQSVVAFHPTRAVLMGGNASGRLHVFAEQNMDCL